MKIEVLENKNILIKYNKRKYEIEEEKGIFYLYNITNKKVRYITYFKNFYEVIINIKIDSEAR